MKAPTVTFETKCWERDWKILLTSGRLERMIEACDYGFPERILYINNVRDRAAVCRRADRLVARGVITRYRCVEDYAEAALSGFHVDRTSFGTGYYYSIQELVGIYLCETDYLLHFSGDSMVTGGASWIDAAIERMESDATVKVANPSWDDTFVQAKAQSRAEDAEFYRGFGFSDQCYLIRAADFKKPMYNERHIDSERYPRYGGELFEKRVDAFMRNHNFMRITSKKASYRHHNFPRDGFRRWILLKTGINLKK
jgi:DNA-binding Lrp family transcriptional regulator